MQLVHLPAQFINTFQVLLPGKAHRNGSRLPDRFRRPVFPRQGTDHHIANSQIVLPVTAVDSFQLQTGFFHGPSGLWIVHIMSGFHPVQTHSIKQVVHHSPQGFRHNAPAPESPAHAVSQLRSFCFIMQNCHRDIADDTAGLLPFNGPVEKTAVAVTGDPVVQHKTGHVNTTVSRPGQELRHFRIRSPVAEHILRVLNPVSPEDQSVGLDTLRSGLVHGGHHPFLKIKTITDPSSGQ